MTCSERRTFAERKATLSGLKKLVRPEGVVYIDSNGFFVGGGRKRDGGPVAGGPHDSALLAPVRSLATVYSLGFDHNTFIATASRGH